MPTRSQEQLGGARPQLHASKAPGEAGGPDAPLRATATALERARDARSVILVEGISDQIAVEALADLQGRDLVGEGIVVVPTGGAHAVARFLLRFGAMGDGLRIGGLCDAAEQRHLCRALARTGHSSPATRLDLERQGFFICDRDLEDELLRAVGPGAFETMLAEERDLGSFRTLQKQAAWRDASFIDQARRFLGAGARRKLRYAGLLVRASDLAHQPRALRNVLSWA